MQRNSTGTMISVLLAFVVALAPENASPSPAPTSAPSRLQEIGRVKSLPVCTPIVVRANSAINDALENDSTINLVIARLRNMDYDSANPIGRHKIFNELADYAKKLRVAGSAGDAEVKKLRELADASPNEVRKKELKDFADALGGAIYRQKKVGTDLDKALTIYDGRLAVYDIKDIKSQSSAFDTLSDTNNPVNRLMTPTPRTTPTPPPFNPEMRSIADEFAKRLDLVAADEGVAADHSIGATTGC